MYDVLDFDPDQLLEIYYGYDNGLTREQVSLYANTDFYRRQMQEIRKGLENGLSEKKMKFYANSNFTEIEMEAIRRAFEINFTIKEVKEILARNPKILIFVKELNKEIEKRKSADW